MNPSDLTKLMASKNDFETLLGRFEVWLLVFGIFVGIGVVGESIFGIRTWWNSRKLQEVNQQIDQYRQSETSQVNQKAGEALERATVAEQHLAEANERAEIARKEAEGFRLQIADAAKQAAQADAKAAQATLDLAKYRAGRKLTSEQQQRIAARIKLFSGTPYELAVAPGSEAVSLLSTIDAILRESGWDTKESAKTDFRFIITLPSGSKVEQIVGSGVEVLIPQSIVGKYGTAASTLVTALRSEGIETRGVIDPKEVNSPNNVHITVGSQQ
ncbi:MAG TPA: hypothetical protein VN862_04120 [Candidatus Acidoferrales bacterium]|nr:hypothetical protein [Candidatus Acidoferrales bacterium]